MKRLLLTLALFTAAVAYAATPVYLTDSASDINPGAETELATAFTRGAGVQSATCTTTSGGTLIQLAKSGTAVTWLTGPLNAVTIAGTITFNCWAQESSNSANSTIKIKIERTNAAGAVQSVILDAAYGSELPTNNNTAKSWTGTPTSTGILAGERIKITIKCVNSGTMGAGYTVTGYYAGTTAAASGDTYVSFTEAVAPYTTTSIKAVSRVAYVGIGKVAGLTPADSKAVAGVPD
ncbi:MAG TPA: hypothetical protein VGM51_09520 [Armatimonadota bacterium]|jgi:hypothetical protein